MRRRVTFGSATGRRDGAWERSGLLGQRAVERFAPTHLVLDSTCAIITRPSGPLADLLGLAVAGIGTGLFDVLPACLRPAVREVLDAAATAGRGVATGIALPRIGAETGAAQVDAIAEMMPGLDGDGDIRLLLVFRDHRAHAGPEPRDVAHTPQPPHASVLAWRSLRAQTLLLERLGQGGADHGVSGQELRSALEEGMQANAALTLQNDRLIRAGEAVRSLLESTLIPTVMLDQHRRIRSFTDGLSELFRVRPTDIGRPLTDLASNLHYPSLGEDVVSVLADGRGIDREVSSRGGPERVYLVRARLSGQAAGAYPGVVMTFVEITDRKRIEDRLWFLAHHDQLTGLANRVALQSFLARPVPEGAAGADALVLLDLDRFKEVNDVFGHAHGDRLLVEVGQRLRACLGPDDLVCRLGGDEFAVVLSAVETAEAIEPSANRLIEAVSRPYRIEGHVIEVGVCAGAALREADHVEPEALMRAADAALYDAKSMGSGRFRLFDPDMQARHHARNALSHDLAFALARDEFQLEFQPLVRLSDRRVVGAEALIRWNHPVRGLIRPDDFVPIAEENGRLGEIGAWVLAEACRCAAGWPVPVSVSVNITARDVGGPGLLGHVRAALDGAGLPAARLILELTEGSLIEDDGRTRTRLAELRALGVRISIDDFGSGYSSLSYLHSFEIDQIKIDRSFVASLQRRQSVLIVRAVVAIARGMGVRVCAEGAETEFEVGSLAALGVDEVQGFYFSPPVGSEALGHRLAGRGMEPDVKICFDKTDAGDGDASLPSEHPP